MPLPLGLKYGNIADDKYLYVAAEVLVQFDYKEKAFNKFGDKSIRKSYGAVNTLNYSAMIGYNYKGFTIGAEYTLGNFYDPKYRFQPDKNNASKIAAPSKSNILTFFIGFRTNLSAEKVAAPDKNLQQARIF